MDLGIAPRYVLEALKKQTYASKMYLFGNRFNTRLSDYGTPRTAHSWPPYHTSCTQLNPRHLNEVNIYPRKLQFHYNNCCQKLKLLLCLHIKKWLYLEKWQGGGLIRAGFFSSVFVCPTGFAYSLQEPLMPLWDDKLTFWAFIYRSV